MKKKLTLLFSIFLLTGCIDEVPNCDDDSVKETVLSLTKSHLGYNPIGIQTTQEVVYNENTETRLCMSVIGTTQGVTPVEYQISWKNKDSGDAWIEIVSGIDANTFKY